MINLLLTGAYNYSQEQLLLLENIGFNVIFIQEERKVLNINVSEIEIVVCNNLFLYNKIEKFVNLKIIQLTSAGLDKVPLEYIKRKGIQVYNAKGIYSIPMAEWVILKILEIYKKSKVFYKSQDQKLWLKQRELLELTDKTATIIGYGSVGREVAIRLRAFGVKVIGIGVNDLKSELLDEYLKIENLDIALIRSDIVIVTMPLTNETKHYINKEKLKIMKQDVVLINVSRGGVIDESELIQIIESGKFLGVALDVFEEEPLKKDSPLWDFENVIITPHNSFISEKVSGRLFQLFLKNILGQQK